MNNVCKKSLSQAAPNMSPLPVFLKKYDKIKGKYVFMGIEPFTYIPSNNHTISATEQLYL